MKITVKATNTTLTPAINSHIKEKIGELNKYLKSVDPAVIVADVEVGLPSKHHRSGDVFYAEVNLELPGKLLRSKADGASLQAAVDEVKDELSREIKKYLEKKRDTEKRSRRHLKNHLHLDSGAVEGEDEHSNT